MTNNGMTAIYNAADGTVFNLNDGTTCITLGFEGVGMSDPMNWFQEMPIQDGALYTGTRYNTRIITIYTLLRGTSSADLHTVERHMADVLEPTRYKWAANGTRMGTLDLSWADGAVKTIDAVYKGGATFGNTNRAGSYSRRAALTFDAPRVYFRNANGYVDVNLNAPSGSVDKVNTAFVLSYAGTAPTYPIITHYGPATNPYYTNTGPDGVTRTFGINYAIGSSDTLVTTFERGLFSVRLNPSSTSLGTDLTGYVTQVSGANPEIWTLDHGDNTILIKDQAGSPTSTAKITFYENYMVL